ncbi:glycosyltransferase family 2 protein [Streptomyces odontomachi]|uniref:glycosyltransferase family 2 protein n=1 Tax=Streptomyces odontomachi TaxID=2944940 RepID=UPI00210E9ED4|nr:glycosyltransferase [Streptomyces sp. ODS25]
MSDPDVSVVVGAYEAMPYLVQCLESVEAQTLPAERMEIIAVDDGSTDGSGEYLEKFAARSRIPTRVIRQSNSGGPSGPRNVGLGLARGRYVFFLDADDHLGEEALERMVAMGDENSTDVVLGRVEGVNRGAPKSMWRNGNLGRTDVFSSNIKYTLSAQKLFRRALLDSHGMRFDESLTTGEDALFTLDAYLRADGVSIVADYTCYYLVGRDDGKHATKRGSYSRRFDSARALMGLIADRLPAGPQRDTLMVRPFVITLLPQFGPSFLDRGDKVRQHKMELAKPLMDTYWTEGVAARLKVEERLRLHLVAAGRADLLTDVLAFLREKKTPETVLERRGRRAYLAYPHFRDSTAGVPDAIYAASGSETAHIDGFRPPRRALRVAKRVLARGRRLAAS